MLLVVKYCDNIRDKVIDRNTDKAGAMYVLEGLGPTGWMTIETTGNQELFAYIYVGDEITSDDRL